MVILSFWGWFEEGFDKGENILWGQFVVHWGCILDVGFEFAVLEVVAVPVTSVGRWWHKAVSGVVVSASSVGSIKTAFVNY
jgi:hypothetical protein